MPHFLSEAPVKIPDGVIDPDLFPKPIGNYPYEVELNEFLKLDVKDYKRRFNESIKFHTVGDTGGEPPTVGDNEKSHIFRQNVVNLMEKRRLIDNKFAFFYHLGDIVYENPETDTPLTYGSNYERQFYKAFDIYQGIKLAIPGTHDTQPDLLKAFCQNFCNPHSNNRGVGLQPNHYWKLNAPFVNIIGLSTNAATGQTGKGHIDTEQMAWFVDSLKKCAKEDKPLILAMYFPPLDNEPGNFGGSHGSPWLFQLLTNAFKEAGFYPHMILSAHWHAYQRLTQELDNKAQIIHINASCGGKDGLRGVYADKKTVDPDSLPDGSTAQIEKKWTIEPDFEKPNRINKENLFGFLEFEINKTKINGSFYTFDRNKSNGNETDKFQIDIESRKVINLLP